MKKISRDAIQRMVGGISSSSSVIDGGGGGGGGVSQYWVDDNYVSKEFFNRLFTINGTTTEGGVDTDVVVEPNDLDTDITNIQAMFGFWTNAYLSALGNNPGGGGAELTLASLADVAVQGVTDGQALVWNAAQGKWVPGQGGGIDITAMWAALAQSGVQQINVSHLATALTGYATEAWVGNQGYITGSALNGYATESWVGSQISDMATKTWVNSQIGDMATKTWVGQNYLGLHATADAAAKLATPRTLWGQSFNGTANVSGDMSSVGDIALGNGKRIYNAAQGSGGSLYIGRSDDAGWVYMSDMCSRQGNGYWKVYSNGNSEFANVYSRGYVTALSDVRHKDIQGDVGLTVREIANAPSVKFLWKDRRQEGMQVGSIAQYWQKVMPEAVLTGDKGELTMSYGVIALLSAISIARKVEDHERRIKELEKENKKLRKQLKVA